MKAFMDVFEFLGSADTRVVSDALFYPFGHCLLRDTHGTSQVPIPARPFQTPILKRDFGQFCDARGLFNMLIVKIHSVIPPFNHRKPPVLAKPPIHTAIQDSP